MYIFTIFNTGVVWLARAHNFHAFPTDAFARSGCPFDLQFREVRDGSLVLLWAPPLYEGRGPVTGYMLEMSQGDQSNDWIALHERTISCTHYKVSEAFTRVNLQWFY